MVLGLRSKNKRITLCRVDFFFELQEIKPWPPSKSLKSIRSVALQWENGDKNLGWTSPVNPSDEEGKIELNESFMLPVTLKGNNSGNFQKNMIQLHLYELKRDNAVKGQQLGTTMFDLAQHGIIKDSLRIGLPMNFKRSIKNLAQPILYVKIQSIERDSPGSSSRESLSKEVYLGKDARESVSTLMSEEYAEEDDIASFTDDDVSSYSSVTNSSSAVENNVDMLLQSSPKEDVQLENVSGTTLKEGGKEGLLESGVPGQSVTEELEFGEKGERVLVDALGKGNHIFTQPSQESLSVNHVSLENDDPCSSNSPMGSVKTTPSIFGTELANSLSSSQEATNPNFNYAVSISDTSNGDLREVQTDVAILLDNNVSSGQLLKEEIDANAHMEGSSTSVSNFFLAQSSHEKVVCDESMDDKPHETRSILDNGLDSHIKSNENYKEGNAMENDTKNADIQSSQSDPLPVSFSNAQIPSGKPAPSNQHHEYPISSFSICSNEIIRESGNGILLHDRRRSMSFSVRSPLHSLGTNGHAIANQHLDDDAKEIDVLEGFSVGGVKPSSDSAVRVTRNNVSEFQRTENFDCKVHELESRIEKLEGELREAAAIETAVYSIVAEHGCSMQKMHSPARRLSRLYIHVSKHFSAERKTNAAKSVVSGLVLIARSCGNDVSRLTFWLSNALVLRAIVSHAIGYLDKSNSSRHLSVERNSGTIRTGKKSALKWQSIFFQKENIALTEELEDWEDPQTFVSALEKIESWIFGRIVESVWWQTFIPYMQTTKESLSFSKWKKRFERESSLCDGRQECYSFEIWKKAFMDAREKLCPVRAEGRECGCLPIMAKLVMEQCVARLDVAMFNALLRESDDELPTDPVADPISNHEVLPIPPGKPSFGAGAQLKNTIGNWSRLLTDLFGMDLDDSAQDKNDEYDERVDIAASLKSFHLLNALSDLCMLPKDMLGEEKFRKEACPMFNASVMKRILGGFLPDEFCPDQVPASVFEALDCEVMASREDGEVEILPLSCSPINYSPPSAASIQNAIGFAHSTSRLKRSSSSIVRKSHTSDDELEELQSLLLSIDVDKSSSPSAKTNQNTCPKPYRYQLLREVWTFDD